MKKKSILAWSKPKRNYTTQFAVVVPEDARQFLSERVTSLILAKLYDKDDTYTAFSYENLYTLDDTLDYDEDGEHNLVVSYEVIQLFLTLIDEELTRIDRLVQRCPAHGFIVAVAIVLLKQFKSNVLNAIRVSEYQVPVLFLPFRVLFMRGCRV